MLQVALHAPSSWIHGSIPWGPLCFMVISPGQNYFKCRLHRELLRLSRMNRT
eukprot:jgi/Botrbrau1/20109/Bobra.0173s0012.1